MPPLTSAARRCAPLLVAVFATLAFTASAQASTTATTLPPQNVATNSATLEGQGPCPAGKSCYAYFHWHKVGSGSWYNTPASSHKCSSSSTCTWTQSFSLAGLTYGTGYGYYMCAQNGGTSYVCYGPNGSTSQQQFTTLWLPPANVTPPNKSGIANEFDTLAESHGSWTNSPTGYSYQWQDCDTAGANCVDIPGATSSSYILGAGDIGHTVVVEETAYNGGGASTPSSSSPTAVVGGSSLMTTTGSLTFDGSFDTGVTPWTAGGGSVQCANYGTPSNSPRLRGNFYLVSSPAGQGSTAAQITLPADSNPSAYPLEACDVAPAAKPAVLGDDQYLGIMVYVPVGWTISNKAFYGVEFAEYHFQNIYGAPISFQLHPDHVTVAVQSGGCNNYTTASPGCQYRSQADSSWCPASSTVTCLPKYYAIPPGALVQGAWNEIVLHVHWANDSSGQFQTWYRTAGSPTWTQSSSANGYPTVQWDNNVGCCSSSYIDLAEAYTGALSSPLSIWLDDEVAGTGFSSVAGTMP